MHFYTHHWTKNICAKLYTLSKCVASVCIDYSFQDHDWLNLKRKNSEALIKNKITQHSKKILYKLICHKEKAATTFHTQKKQL